MIAALRTAFTGLLIGAAAYSLVTVYGIFTRANDCLHVSVVPPCTALRMNLVAPGRHEVILAMGCAIASMVAAATTPQDPLRAADAILGQLRRWIDPCIIAAVALALSSLVDPAMHGPADLLATAILVIIAWFAGRSLAGVWAGIEVGTENQMAAGSSPLRGLLSRVLAGLVLTIGATKLVAQFAAQRDMLHVKVGSVALSVVIYTFAAVALLFLAHYVSLRSAWKSRLVIGGETMGARWLWTGALLLAGLLPVAIAAPVVSSGLSGSVGGIYAAFVGPEPVDHTYDCRLPGSHCAASGRTDRNAVRRPRQSRSPRARRADIFTALARLAFWLIPLVPILYFLWGRTGFFVLLRATWRRLRLRSSRLRRRLEARLPGALVDLGASAALARRGGLRLSVREQIVQYYLNTVGYAQRYGVTRHLAQTPEEFELTLHQHLQTDHQAWTMLTADFIEARYGLDPLADEQSERARTAWRITRGAIRRATRK